MKYQQTGRNYEIPADWKDTCDGQLCECSAYGECECGCDADWTPRVVYELRLEVNELINKIKEE